MRNAVHAVGKPSGSMYLLGVQIHPARIELATFRVLGGCHTLVLIAITITNARARPMLDTATRRAGERTTCCCAPLEARVASDRYSAMFSKYGLLVNEAERLTDYIV